MEQILQGCDKLDETTDATEALEVLQQLNSFLNSYFDESKVDQLIAAALPVADDRGIIKYLLAHLAVKDASKKEHEKPKLEALKVLEKLLQDPRFRICVAPLCVKIYKILAKLRRNQLESSKIQDESMQGLIQLLENFQEQVKKQEREFDLSELYRRFLVDQEKSAFTPTVRGKTLECLGILALYGLDSYLKNENQYMQLLSVFVNAIKNQVESGTHHLEANILLGCLKGMDRFIQAFKGKLPPDHPHLQQFYKNLEQIVDPKCSITNDAQTPKLKRREFQRAGLEFIANHAQFFKDSLFENHSLWFDDLLSWSKSSNVDDSKSGIKAMMNFLEATTAHAEFLVKTEAKPERVKAYVQFLADRFKVIMDNQDSLKTELRIAVKGAGLLAGVSPETSVLESLFTKIIQHIEAIIIELNMEVTADKYNSSIALIPTYLEAAGSMLFAMRVRDSDIQEIFQNRLHVVQNLGILLVTYYPELKENYRYFAPDSFLKVVRGLHSNYLKYCEPFLDKIIHEGLTHIIASPTQAEADILVESYKQMNETKKNDAARSSESVYNRLGIRTVKFYTKFWTGLTKRIDEPEFGPIITLVYNKVMEWALKTIEKLDLTVQHVEIEDGDSGEINMADPVFDTQASKAKDFQLFINIVDFLTPFVRFSEARLFHEWVPIYIEKCLEYASEHPLVSGFYRILALSFETSRKLKYFQVEDGKLFALSCGFLQNLVQRIEEFRDDLLLAVLEVWLSAPDEMIMQSSHYLRKTLEAVFRAGRDNLTLARRGFYAMQRWFQIPEFPEEYMEELTNELLPLWLSYFTDAGEVHDEERFEMKSKKSSKGRRYLYLQSILGQELQQTSLKELQLEILKFMGSYGHFIEAGIDDDHNGFSVQPKTLKYEIPFQDIKPAVFIDNFLPRLMTLCFQSTDRQLRSSACEVFHTYVLYFLGMHARGSQEAQLRPWRQIFVAVIKLGSDSDIVIRQLFNPLALQTIHWCTKKHHPLSKVTLDIVVEGLVQSEDTRRRDFSCVCLQEYFDWCAKHQNEDQVKAVVKCLASLSQHAAPQYRQGSVLGFNSIYRTYREDQNLCDRYTLQFLHGFVTSLSLSSEFEESSLLVRTTKRAITHLERIVKKKQDSFNTDVGQRRKIPSDLKGCTLRHMVDWLTVKSTQSWRCCRKECFRLIQEFSPLVRGIASVEGYFRNLESELGRDGLVEIAEKSLALPDAKKIFSRFLEALECCSDFYSFLKQVDYPAEVLLDSKGSKFYRALRKFLLHDLERFQHSPESAKDYCDKIMVIVISISHLQNVLPKEMEACVIEATAILWKAQAETSFRENPALIEAWKQYWNHCSDDSDVWSEILPRLKNVFRLDFSTSFTANSLKWFSYIVQQGFLSLLFTTEELKMLFDEIWETVETMVFVRKESKVLEEKQMSNRERNIVPLLFDVAVGLGIEEDRIVQKVFDPTLVKRMKTKISKGEIYQDLFLSSLPLCSAVLQFQELATRFSLENVGRLIQHLLLSVKGSHRLRKDRGRLVVRKCLEIWRQLALNCSFPVIAGLISGMAALHMEACRDSMELSEWWCGLSMMKNPNLTLKDKSEFIHFLGLFTQSTNSVLVDNVLSTVHDMVREGLTADLSWNVEKNYIVKILQAVLNVFEKLPQNLEIVRIIILVVAKAAELSDSEGNICSALAKKRLEKVVPKLLDYNAQLLVLNTMYSLVTEERSIHSRTLAVTKYCLLPLSAAVSERTAKLFYLEHINDIERKAGIDTTSAAEACVRITAINLVEIMCLRKWSNGVFLTGNELNAKYLERLGKEPGKDNTKECAKRLIKAFTKLNNPSRKNIPDEKLRKLVLETNQAAFNAVQAMVRVLRSDLKIALNLVVKLQSENYEGWNNVVDCESEYTFPVVFESSSVGGAEVDNSSSVSADVVKANARATRKYGLLSSSLAMEATQYDFTASVNVEESKYYQKIFGEDNGSISDDVQTGLYKSSTKLEWSLVNQHPCMLSFVESMRYFHERQSKPGNDGKMMEMVNTIKGFLTNYKLHKNVKIFHVGAILNCKQIFQPYADALANCIVKLVVDGVFGAELNYFVKDTLVMLLEWGEACKLNPSKVTELLKFYLPKVPNSRRDVFDQHLSLLQVVISQWVKDPEVIPRQTIVEVFEADTKAGFEICKRVILGGHLPCSIKPDGDGFDLRKLFKIAEKAFGGTSKVECCLAGEVVGLAFKKMEDLGETSAVEGAGKYFCGQIMDKTKGKQQTFFTVLKSVQLFYPRIVLQYREKVFESLRDKNVGVDALRMIPTILKSESRIDQLHGSPDAFDDFHKELEGRGVFRKPCSTSEEMEAATEIMEGFVGEIKDEVKACTLINWAKNAESSTDPLLRARFASTVSKLYLGFGNREHLKQLPKAVHRIFIALYQDESQEVAKMVTDFWENDLKTWTDTPTLFLELLEILGSDRNAIYVVIDLVMKRCSLSPDYTKVMFDKLGDCVFEPYNLDTSWRMRNVTFQPLYAESLSSLENFSRLPQSLRNTIMSQRQATGKSGMNLLRATLTLKQFTPTAPGQYSSESSAASSQTSGSSFSSQQFYGNYQASASPESEESSPLAQLRRRFYARPSSESYYYSGRSMTRTEAGMQRKLEAVQAKRSGVKLLRTYRIGELPDVMMKHEDFLKMVSAMTKIDQELGRAIVVQMFSSILSDVQDRDSHGAAKLHRRATRTFNEILKTHQAELCPQFAAAIVEISLVNHQAISLQPTLISTVCRTFELQKLGILQFEAALEHDDSAAEKEAKRSKTSASEDSPETDLLLRLAELYKDIDDFDSVGNLFDMASQYSVDAKELYQKGCRGLRSEGMKHYDEALDVYVELHDEERAREERMDERRLQFWEDSVRKCLLHLSKWEDLFEVCENYALNLGEEAVFESIEYLDNILPSQLAAGTQILVRDESDSDNEPPIIARVRKFLEVLRAAENVWDVLLGDTVDIAAMSAVFEHEVGTTLTYLDKVFNTSIETFRIFKRISKPKKEKELLKLMRGSVLYDYLNWQPRRTSHQDLDEATDSLMAKWGHCGRPKTASLVNTDFVVAERDHFLTNVGTVVSESMSDQRDNMLIELREIDHQQYVWLGELSIQNSNNGIALRALKKAKAIGSGLEQSFTLEWYKLLSKYLIRFTEGRDWQKTWASGWKSLAKLDNEADREGVLEARWSLLKALLLKTDGKQLDDATKVMQALQIPPETDLNTHVSELVVQMAKTVAEEAKESSKHSPGIHMQMYDVLSLLAERTSDSASQSNGLNKFRMISLLRALQGEDANALYLLPTTFQALEQSPDLIHIFQEYVKAVPSWMFVPWLDQVVVNHLYSDQLRDILGEVIDRLLTDFPQAFQLQYVNLMKRKNLPKLYETYAEALHAVTVPWVFFRAYFLTRTSVSGMLENLNKFLLKADAVRGNPHIYGCIYTTFLNKVIPEVLKIKKQLEELASSGDSSQANSKAAKLMVALREQLENDVKREFRDDKSRTRKLSDFSPWLAKFRSSAYEDIIEVPGLYQKFEKPRLQFHEKIVSFFPTVTVMSSLTMPIRLTLMCDNGKERSYLVKRGDDLRQDKRIQQCFHVANSIFRNDPQCRQRRLRLSTFAVVPLNEEFGMIEWVENTVPLKDLVLNSRELRQTFDTIGGEWNTWLKSSFDQTSPYHVFAQRCPRREAEKKFDEFAGKLRPKLLRDHILQGCTSLEDFFVIRQQMIRSYATMCIVHWILGIGDRHLENSLVATATGEFIGIDFGRSFGTTAFLQSVPELVPFRLTPQIQSLLAPYGCNGIFKETMMHCLTPLKKSSKLLATVVDVFMREPVKDWLLAPRRRKSSEDYDTQSSSVPAWDPIETVKQKLSGENPLRIIVKDIQLLNPPTLRSVYTKLIKDGRGMLSLEDRLNDEQYVDMLISIATDKNILSRMYVGWAPWV